MEAVSWDRKGWEGVKGVGGVVGVVSAQGMYVSVSDDKEVRK